MAFPSTPQTPIIGQGLLPGGQLGAQLAAITHRIFLRKVYVQIFQSHVLLSLFMANAQKAAGGVGPITIPVQGAPFTTFSWGSFAGDFNLPVDQAAIENAQLNLKLGMVPVGFFGMETLVQDAAAVVPKLKVVMSDAGVSMQRGFASGLYSNNVANTNAWDGLPEVFDDGTNVGTYAGIARTGSGGNNWWAGQLITNTNAAMTTRVGAAGILSRVQSGAGGEKPDYIVMNPANWTQLMADYQNIEQFTTLPRSIYDKNSVINTGFSAIRVIDTPCFPDPYCPLGTAYLINSRYISLYMSELAPMTFSGFHSQISTGQISEIGVLISVGNLACGKPSSGAQVTGITGAAWPNVPGSTPSVV